MTVTRHHCVESGAAFGAKEKVSNIGRHISWMDGLVSSAKYMSVQKMKIKIKIKTNFTPNL
jgi:hypothetical protein